ncbi:MAG TPA: 3-deoxy-manno-octulosonate cytidylyltransferase [Candidatus Gemmiger faecigallinarum]|nr:3-deoxy-manno-octulosonate cytidylyltransferase [Candidatus Gemmiger faecigallinarum]
MKTIAVIPARYQSSRMPGKPLADILGRPMIWWVWREAKKCPALSGVVVATDDERIADACKAYGMDYCMTSPDHDTPTGRIWEVSTKLEADLYLQVMGDEPLINAAAFDLILPKTLPQDPYYVAVLTNVMEHPADVVDFSNQKVVTNAAREILMISRSPIPYPKGTLDFEYEKVTGIQLYSRRALAFYHDTPKSLLEKAEENDMMRFVENGHKVHAITSPYKTVSVDTPKDLALVSRILQERGETQG